MFGAFRLLLALVVLISHLWGSEYARYLGYYAVRAFFVLSGFLMTAALNDVYAFDGKRFWTNRALRLIPTYVISIALVGFVVAFDPAEAGAFKPTWASAPTAAEILGNLAIVPLVFEGIKFRLIEPAWSLGAEIIMYGVLFLVAARGKRLALVVFAAGVVFHLYALSIGVDFQERYANLASILMPFGLGAMLYFLRRRTPFLRDRSVVGLVFIVWLCNFFVAGAVLPQSFAEYGGYYLNTALSALLVIVLDGRRLSSPALRRLDALAGELSYPVFLTHWLGGYLAVLILSKSEMRGWAVVLTGAPITLLIAAALAWFNARFIEPIRREVREAAPAKTPLTTHAIAVP